MRQRYITVIQLQFMSTINNSDTSQPIQQREDQQIIPSAYNQKYVSNRRPDSNPKDAITDMIDQHWIKIIIVLVVIILFSLFYQFSSDGNSLQENQNQNVFQSSQSQQGKSQLSQSQSDIIINKNQNIQNVKRLSKKQEEKGTKAKSNGFTKILMNDDKFLGKSSRDQFESSKKLLSLNRDIVFEGKTKFKYLKYAKLNMNISTKQTNANNQKLLQKERSSLNKKYKIEDYSDQLSICVIIYDQNANKKQFSEEYVLNSVYNQIYNDYSVVYIADGHSQDRVSSIKATIKQKDTNNRTVLLWSQEKKYLLQSLHYAIKKQCKGKQITTYIGGEDELLGRYTFKLLNAAYQSKKANVVYTNYVQYHPNYNIIRSGFAKSYSSDEKGDLTYRDIGQKFGKLLSFKTSLVEYIQQKDLKDQNGNYQKYAGDYALIFPLLELSCGQVVHIPQPNCLLYIHRISSDDETIQVATGRSIRFKDKYKCYKEFNI